MKKRLYNTIITCLSIPFLLIVMALLGLLILVLPLFVFIKPDLIETEKELKPVELRKVESLPKMGTYGVLYDYGTEHAVMWCKNQTCYEKYLAEIKEKNLWDVNKVIFFIADD